MAYQSLYRRYRPQKFSEIRGQNHVVTALRNAVAKDQVGHAYMFSGPRGTGKTSSARVLAKALNCERLGEDSEPCGTCESCVAIEQGRSFDLHELDAASNNGVEDMRDLLGKVNLGNPGRMKVYILDEVHMLTRGAENSLLKTLEEPPSHVVWVLATTEPHKVVETIRSRCQVFELGLLGAEEMTAHVRWVIEDAALDVDDSAVDYVVSVGDGSVRDTLSALDRVVAAGGVVEIDQSTDQLLHALAVRDTAAALGAVGDALGRGRDPRTIGEMLVAGLRDAFLTVMGSPPPRITVAEQERASQIAEQMSPLQLTRALETLGTALVEMRQAPDPRVHLEVSLVRLCRPVDDGSVDSLLARIEQLEARLAAGTPTASPAFAAEPPAPVAPVPVAPVPVAPVPVAPVPVAPVPAAPVPAPVAPVPAAPVPVAPVPAASSAPVAPVPAAPVPAPAPVAGLAPEVEPEPDEPRQLEGFAVAPKLPPPPPLAASAQSAAEEDLRSFQPKSAKEVVELAGLHLSLGRNLVITRANSFLGPAQGKRSEDDLQRLWRALVDEFGPDSVPDAPALADEPPAVPQDDPAEDPTQDETRGVGPASVGSPIVGPANVDPAGVGPANVDPPQVETANVDPPQVETANVDPPQVETANVDPPQVETANVDPPQVETANVDPPQVETANVDPPQVETANVDPPQVETAETAGEASDEGADEASDAGDADGDGLDLDELIDASSHTDQVVELLEEAFPGAEIETPPAAKVDQ